MSATISARILANVSRGMPLEEAVDAVLGYGTFQTLAGEVYRALRTSEGR